MSTEPINAAADAATAEALIEAGVFASESAAFERGLVVLATGRPFWLEPTADGGAQRLLIEREAHAHVGEQLRKYERESVAWPPRVDAETEPARETEFFTPMLWLLAVSMAFWAQGRWAGLTDAGAVNGTALFDRGEWWRPATALFLHADAGHLVANGLSGLFVFAAVTTVFGRARGWSWLALTSVVANIGVALFNRHAGTSSIGASTAIFAGLGLLTGRALLRSVRRGWTQGWGSVVAPLIGGGSVLALYGAGDLRTDVLAHALGFVAGLALGALSEGGSLAPRAK